MDLKKAILGLVCDGIKSNELFSKLALNVSSNREIEVELLNLLHEGEIIEIEYTLPGARVSKSFFLPKNTEIRHGQS